MELTNAKRTQKLASINENREEILRNKAMSDLKAEISQLTRDEMNLETKMSEIQLALNKHMHILDSYKKELDTRKFYCNNDNQTLEEAIEAENEMIERARAQLDRVKQQKNDEYNLIEKEFELVYKQSVAQFESNNAECIRCNLEIHTIADQESKLKEILEKGLYENEEEKCLVEKELAEIGASLENLHKVKFNLKQVHLNELNEKMANEYKSLNDMKRLDLEELKQDEDRIQLLEENSIKLLLDKMRSCEKTMHADETQLKQLETENKCYSKKMNQLLNEVNFLINLNSRNKFYCSFSCTVCTLFF